jgi:type VI secretion system protein ImpA
MPAETLVSEELLDPIAAEQPAGVDLRWTAEWDRIKEARRSDDTLDSGKWAKKDRKTSDWPLVQSLVTTALRERSKDLQLSLWLTEANIKLHGFPGLRDGLRLTRELMVRYWDKGLYPAMEDGPEDRAGPFEWLNNKLVDSIETVSITPRLDQGVEYSFLNLKEARHVGSEANWKTADGEIDEKRKKTYDQAVADGHISMEMFERVLRESKRAGQEELNLMFQQTCEEFRALERVIEEKFGDVAPSLSDCRSSLGEIDQALADFLNKKRREEPDASPANGAPAANDSAAGVEGPVGLRQDMREGASVVFRLPLSISSMQGSQQTTGDSWQEAEAFIRSGEVEKGLVAMTRLAASETSGRNRFQRKLLLAEVCLASGRERLARSILEELAEQIDKFQLELWESSELISAVWTMLHKLYRQDESDLDRATKLYERLCRLDPWQALGCGEG